jgi:hypothetical protein
MKTMSKLRNLRRCEAGGTTLEFAIIACAIILLSLGLVELGRALHVRNEISYAADFAARKILADPEYPTSDLEAEVRSVVELAAAADVSLGQVSNVRTGLIDREWAQVTKEGLRLSKPDALLDAWRETYQPQGKRLGFYTTLHGGAFEEAARRSLGVDREEGQAVFASFSAAQWLAPYGRTGTQYFYADEVGLERLRAALKLSSAAKGENVTITLPKDDGLFRDSIEPAPRSFCTSPVQTYLDLAIAGERGREAADHLRQTKLTWPN